MRASFDASGEVLVVTGGANGIAAALACAYAGAGGTAVVLDIVPSAALDGVERLVQKQVDVADRDAVFAAVNEVVAEHGAVDALLASAAVQPRVDIAEMDPEVWTRTLAVNLNGVVWACQAVLPGMIERRRGSILMFASNLANTGLAQASAYAASKGGIIAFGKSLAAEVAGHDVRVNVVFPGIVDTPQFRRANGENAREQWASIGVGEPEDVVGPLMFLLSAEATMTGSTLTRDRVYPERA
jgi:3-oxoacyl-[acyl-carrier protein] reductase